MREGGGGRGGRTEVVGDEEAAAGPVRARGGRQRRREVGVGAGGSPAAPCLDRSRLGAVPRLVESGEENNNRRVAG